jgi:hypothetical protein
MSLPVRRRAVIVLGFHRSGTSMLMRLLNLLGVYLGPEEDLLEAVEADNPRGYWEPRWVNDLNDAILARFGGTYDDPPRLPAGWHADPSLDALRAEARAGLRRAFDGAALWGVKDPRLCLTLPFWQPLLAEQADEVLHLHALRSPVETTASMLRRNIYPGTDAAFWGGAWLEHTAGALEATAGRARRLVFYDDLIAGGLDAVPALAALLGVPAPAGEAAERARDAIDAGLRHHATTLVDTACDAGLPAAARAAYVSLRAAHAARAAGPGPSDLADALEHVAVALWREAVAAPDDAHGLLVEAIGEMQQADVTVEGLRREAETVREQVRRLAADAAEARAARAG